MFHPRDTSHTLLVIMKGVAPFAGEENYSDFGQKQDLGMLPGDQIITPWSCRPVNL